MAEELSTIPEITLEDIKALEAEMKVLDKSWVAALAKRMKKDNKKVDASYVYRITNGFNSHQSDRRLFVNHAAEMKTFLIQKQKEAIEKLTT